MRGDYARNQLSCGGDESPECLYVHLQKVKVGTSCTRIMHGAFKTQRARCNRYFQDRCPGADTLICFAVARACMMADRGCNAGKSGEPSRTAARSCAPVLPAKLWKTCNGNVAGCCRAIETLL